MPKINRVWFNDHEPLICRWLQELFPGDDVDGRGIEEVYIDDLSEFRRCHFFAGIGGWELALRWVGWPEEREVWTGSCPCQPFSNAGKMKGEDDARHLWPVWREIIRQRRPATIFGEQVAGKLGRKWLAGVRADLEALGYAVGAADLCAAGVGAPHIRQRLYWVAHLRGPRSQGNPADRGGIRTEADAAQRQQQPERHGEVGQGLGDLPSAGPQRQRREHRSGGGGDSGQPGFTVQAGCPSWNGPTGFIECSDGTRRASLEPGAFPLAYGVPARVGRLRGYGNAIVPQVALVFIRSFLEAEAETRAAVLEGHPENRL